MHGLLRRQCSPDESRSPSFIHPAFKGDGVPKLDVVVLKGARCSTGLCTLVDGVASQSTHWQSQTQSSLGYDEC